MADSVVIAVTSGLASAVVGGALTYITTFKKIRQELAAQYDADLRRDRISVYKKLWKCLEPLAEYAPEHPLTFDGTQTLAASLRRWYYEEGGLFLSEEARKAYFDLQDELKAIQGAGRQKVCGEHGELGDRLKTLMKRRHQLHSQLAADVGTRAAAMLRST